MLDAVDYIKKNGRSFWHEVRRADDANNRQKKRCVDTETEQYAFADMKTERNADILRTSHGLELAFSKLNKKDTNSVEAKKSVGRRLIKIYITLYRTDASLPLVLKKSVGSRIGDIMSTHCRVDMSEYLYFGPGWFCIDGLAKISEDNRTFIVVHKDHPYAYRDTTSL